MYVVLIRFHATYIPVVSLGRLINILLNICSECAMEQTFSVLCHEYKVYHEKIFIVAPMLIFVHLLISLLTITMFYVIIYVVNILYHIERVKAMREITKTLKLRLYTDYKPDAAFKELTSRYAEACTYVSQYVFDHGFILNFMKLQEAMYSIIRDRFGLKAQMTISVFKTVTARYKTVQEQLKQHPYRFKSDDKRYSIPRTLEWLTKPVVFSRPQADLVRNRDYSFAGDCLSLNTLGARVKVKFAKPAYFGSCFDGTWKFGTGKLVNLNGIWYFHVPVTKVVEEEFDSSAPKHVVGIDRGLRFLAVAYDEKENTTFISGKDIMAKRDRFADTRAELQSKGTRSAKRALKRISGRENRWMSDVNHCVSKTLVDKYGSDTLFVLEDLTDVSFDEGNLSRGKKQNRELRSWSFYQFEQFLRYKADAVNSETINVSAEYTSQRCPKCGRILKANRNHDTHEYVCDCCGYRSNDDRVGAMNIYTLGTMYVSGDANPRFGARKVN